MLKNRRYRKPFKLLKINYVWQAVTNLIVGNTVIIKHSELVPLCSKFVYNMVSSVLPEEVINKAIMETNK